MNHWQKDRRAWMRAIGASIRARRIAVGWHQGQLAERAEITNSNVSAYECGTTMVTFPRLAAISTALGLPAWQIMADAEAILSSAREAAE